MDIDATSSIVVFDSISKKLAEAYPKEVMAYIKSSHDDFDIPMRKKKKPHHRKKRKGWEY